MLSCIFLIMRTSVWVLSSRLLIILLVLPQFTLTRSLFRSDLFPLSIIHINDFHARYEPTDTNGGTCNNDQECIGGYARTFHTVKRLVQEQKENNPIYLNAGDNFQGTLWYNIGRWNVTSQFLNMLPADAMTLGNHEFDHGIEGVVPFLETLDSPVIVTNMNSSNEPTMEGKYKRSLIIERGQRKIGILGALIETVYDLANIGNLTFRNESEAVLEEGLRLKAQGCDIIILITHCGYDVDQEIARHAGSVVDVIVGGHSHTFLSNKTDGPGPLKPQGNYPTEVIHSSGQRVLIVQAASYARYVGNLIVYFDNVGNVVDYEGGPLYMDSSVPEDPDILEAIKPWKAIVDLKGNEIVGETKVDLLKNPCNSKECNLGNFFSDAMIHSLVAVSPYNEEPWTSAAIGLVNNGALRVPLLKGTLTYAHLITMSPFENVLTSFNLPGAILLEALEFAVQKMDLSKNITSSQAFLQISGLKIVYDLKRPPYQRVVELQVRCAACSYPRYEPFDKTKTYRIVAPIFLVNGGDGFHMIRDHSTDIQYHQTDLDALLNYTNKTSPIITGIEGRIIINK
uniref:apyrase n=2 Tax=Glossina morsitans morsitans TaxID=37546 RepID=D3TM90_GLOMM